MFLQLFGFTNGIEWQKGLFTAVVGKAYKQAQSMERFRSHSTGRGGPVGNVSVVSKWIVLDGELNLAWNDAVNALLNVKGEFRAPNGETVTLHGRGQCCCCGHSTECEIIFYDVCSRLAFQSVIVYVV